MHYKDKERLTTDPKPGDGYFRLLGVDDQGETYFYWSENPGEFAAYYGPSSKPVWGTLTCKNSMLPKNKVFIADYRMAKKLEKLGIMLPCGNCNREEYNQWKEANDNGNSHVQNRHDNENMLETNLYAPATREYLENKNQEALNTFRESFDLIEEQSRFESAQRTEAYRDRQVYELIQNAADAISTNGRPGNIHVLLTDEALYCANQGSPISCAGLRAIMKAYLSEKKGEEIGRYGLGFKSVLAVSDRPEFHGPEFSFRFDKNWSATKIRNEVPGYPTDKPTPTLRLAEPIDTSEFATKDSALSYFLERYTTVVKLPFNKSDHSWLSSDLEKFPSEFLLFTPMVSTLTLEDQTNDSLRKFRREHGKNSVTTIVDAVGDDSDNEKKTHWKVFEAVVTPNQEAIEEAGFDSGRSELKLWWAVPSSKGGGGFWAFFPLAKERMSMRGILNVAWKLDGQRQNILPGKFNEELLDAAGSLIFQNLSSLVDPLDPGSLLELFPGRLAERQNFDEKLTAKFYLSSRNHATIPDTGGALRKVDEISLPPSAKQLNEAAVTAWAECLKLPKGWAHPSTVATDARSARIDGLRFDTDYLRGSMSAEDRISLDSAKPIKRASVREWIEALVDENNLDSLMEIPEFEENARALASFHAVKVASCLLGDPNMEAGVHMEVKAAKIFLTAEDKYVALNESVFLPSSEDKKRNYEVNVVHDELLKVNGMTGVLESLDLHTVNADSRLKALLQDANLTAYGDPNWDELWSLVNAVEMAPSTAGTSAKIIRDHFNEFRKRFYLKFDISGVINVKTVDGRFRPINATLIAGSIVEFGDQESSIVLVNDAYHKESMLTLKDLGAVEGPEESKGSREEHYFLHYRNQAKTLFFENLRTGGNPRDGLLDFNNSSMPGPLDPMRGLSKSARVKFTERLLEFHSEQSRWTFRHETQTDRYPKVLVDSPSIWNIKKYGRLRTAYSSCCTTDAVGPSLLEWADFLPVAQVSPEIAELLNLPESFENIPERMLSNALESRIPPVRDLPNIKYKKPFDWGIFYSKCCELIQAPDKLACFRGKAESIHNTCEIVVADRNSQAKLVELRAQNIPFVEVESREQAAKLIEQWGLKGSDIPIEISAVQSGPEVPVGDYFPKLGMRLDEIQEEFNLHPCSTLRVEIADAEGTTSRDHDYLVEGNTIYWLDTFVRRELLEKVLSTLDIQLGEYEFEGILKNRLEQEQQDKRLRVKEEELLNKKLVIALDNIAPMKALLPAALLEYYKEAEGGLTDERVAQLFLDVFGVESLKKLREELKKAGFQSPNRWTGGYRSREFVRELGFPEEYSGFPKSGREPEVSVLGPTVLPPLHDFQEDAATRIKSLFRADEDRRRGMLSLPTGAGKTRVAVEAIVRAIRDDGFRGPILWVAQTDELCEQAVQSWTQLWHALGTGRTLTINRLWASNEAAPVSHGHQIVVATESKMGHVIESDSYSWLKEASAVVIDEAHHSIAPIYTRIFEWLGIERSRTRCPLLGLSATAYRGGQEEAERLAKRYGMNRLDAGIFPGDDPYGHLQSINVLAKVDHEILEGIALELSDSELAHLEQMKSIPSSALERLGANADRNRSILAKVMSIPEDWPILLYAASVDHARSLAAIFVSKGISAASVSAETDKNARRYYIDKFKKGEIRVLTNYGVLTTGFDAPSTRVIIVGRPTFSPIMYQQMIGRGLRGPKNGGKEKCLIVNVKDTFEQFGEKLAFTEFEYIWGEGDGRSSNKASK